MDHRLLELLVCPICKGPLDYRREAGELVCAPDRLAFPIRDGMAEPLSKAVKKLDW